MSVLKISNVTKRFKDKIVLDNISLEIEEGEVFGFIGPNGAGKSTMLNIVTGILGADGGKVEICGFDIEKEDLKAKACIGYVMQDLAIMESLNAYDNLEYFGAFYGLSGKLLKERIQEALELTGLTDTKKKKVAKFSGGMKRRLNMAIGILHHPKFLILDEPTVGVDVQSRNHIFNFIKNVAKKWGTTVLYTSHYMEEVEELCDKLFIMDKGKEIASGTKQDILSTFSKNKNIEICANKITNDFIKNIESLAGVIKVSDENKKIKLIVSDDFNITSILKVCDEYGIIIEKINYIEEKLEDIFIELTGSTLRD